MNAESLTDCAIVVSYCSASMRPRPNERGKLNSLADAGNKLGALQ